MLRRCLGLLALGSLLGLAPAVAVSGAEVDPVRVLVEHPHCPSGVLQVERYRRVQGDWVEHPRFPVLATDSCVVADAGGLLNEVRLRCIPRRVEDPVEAWRVGVPVFEPGVIDACKLPEDGALRVEIRQPEAGAHLSGEAARVRVRGLVERVGQGGTDDLQWLAVENVTLASEPTPIRVDGRGRFLGAVELGPGPNHVRVTARDLQGRSASHGVAVVFDAADAREQARAAERARMERSRRERSKEVTIESLGASDAAQ